MAVKSFQELLADIPPIYGILIGKNTVLSNFNLVYK